ncbi:MAG TPA: TonB-dependent receptor, partial [Chitinophagaceae bacterium]|nr:TonB-dependent receptor [Chitinophagaceae bacterium]
IMKTGEDISGDHYYQYKNASGEIITAQSTDQVPVDSTRFDVGWLRRPTDRRVTFGMYFSDYLPTNKNFKMYLNLLYGSNMPYNIPNAVRYRNAAQISPYIRCDIGFSALLMDDDRSNRRSHSPFRNFDNIWLSLEVFNIIDRPNTISYLFVKDFSNTVFLMPNRLTPRLVNFKIVARW